MRVLVSGLLPGAKSLGGHSNRRTAWGRSGNQDPTFLTGGCIVQDQVTLGKDGAIRFFQLFQLGAVFVTNDQFDFAPVAGRWTSGGYSPTFLVRLGVI